MIPPRPPELPGPLAELACAYGVLTGYHDVGGRWRPAGPEAVQRVLRALGAPLSGAEDAVDALLQRRRETWERGLEPVVVAWEGRPGAIPLRLPEERMRGAYACEMVLESGRRRRLSEGRLEELPLRAVAEIGGERFEERLLPDGPGLPEGRHRLQVEAGGSRRWTSTVLAAPARCPDPPEPLAGGWGLFAPTYALRRQGDRGIGDLTALRELGRWTRGLGGAVVQTLPLLATFLDEPFEPSPYAPVTRLFWSEAFADVEEAWRVDGARPSPVRPCDAAGGEVDYREMAARKRRALEPLARRFFERRADRRRAFQAFLTRRPEVRAYARFRAAVERTGSGWREWPPGAWQAGLGNGEKDRPARRFHLYVQYLLERQLRAAASAAPLYLDLPLGVHPNGYDAFRHRELFAEGIEAGAPPDDFFAAGQKWGFAPPRPDAVRREGHRYAAACLRHHLRHARGLRIDHVMGFHRMFWVPDGMDATDGVYVEYPWEESYALLTLESGREGVMIVGEDLGTVPDAVRETMARRGVRRTYVLGFELTESAERTPRPVPSRAVASLDTHDTWPFAGYWSGVDIDERRRRGLLSAEEADRARERRQAQRSALTESLRRRGHLRAAAPGGESPGAAGPSAAPAAEALEGALSFLAESPADLVVVSLEDLWGEQRPQNRPGTTSQFPNWRRRADRTLEEIRRDPLVAERLERVEEVRRRAREE